jgi:acyl-CoA thioester hydrolase
LLEDFPVIAYVPVQWGEMDAYGHVNNTVFFRLFETARIEYLRRIGFTESYERDRVGAILHSTHCRFRHPLVYPDTVLVGARVTDVGEDRFTMGYVIVSLQHEAIAAEGGGIVVSFDYRTRRKTSLPSAVRTAIERTEAERNGSAASTRSTKPG